MFAEGELEILSYNEIVKLAKENGISVFRKKKVYLIRKLLALNEHRGFDSTQNASRCQDDAENFADISGPEVFDKENKVKVETRRSVLIYKPSGIADEEIKIADNKRRSTYDIKSSEVVDRQNQLNNITTRRSLFKEKQVLALSDLNSKTSGEENTESSPKGQNSTEIELPPDVPDWVKRGTEVKRETRRSTFLVKAQNSAKKDRTSVLNQTIGEDTVLNSSTIILDTSDVPNWAKVGAEVDRETRRSTFIVKPRAHDVSKNDVRDAANAAQSEPANTRRSTFVVKPTDDVDLGQTAESPPGRAVNTRRSTFVVRPDIVDVKPEAPVKTSNTKRSISNVKATDDEKGNKTSHSYRSAIEESKLNSTIDLDTSAVGENLDSSGLNEMSASQRKPKRSGTFVIDSPMQPRHGVSLRANQTFTTVLEPLDESEELSAIPKSSPPTPTLKRKSVRSSSVAVDDNNKARGKQTRRSLLNRSATFVVDSPAVGESVNRGKARQEAAASVQRTKPERSGTFVIDSPKDSDDCLATPKRSPAEVNGRRQQSIAATVSTEQDDKENDLKLAKTPKIDDSGKKAAPKENSKVRISSRVHGSTKKVFNKHQPVIRTPMSVRKQQANAAENKTPRSKSAVKQPWNSGLKSRMPNFNAIHKRQFDRMESLVDNVKRKELRTLQLFSPPTAATRKIPTLKPTRQNTIVMDSPGGVSCSAVLKREKSKKSFIPVAVFSSRSQKTAAIGEEEKTEKKKKKELTKNRLATKIPPASVENTRQKERNNIIGVRANRRFLLQLEMRNIK